MWGFGGKDGHCSIWYVGSGGSHTRALGKWCERPLVLGRWKLYLSLCGLEPPGAGWLMPAALPQVFPASGAHPGPAQVCSDSGSCCGAWCLCGPSPCLAPGPSPYPDLDHPCHAPSPSLFPCPSLGCALDASPAPAVGSVPVLLPSPAPFALPLLAPFAASPAPWPVQPALPPSEQSAAGGKGRGEQSQPHSRLSHFVSVSGPCPSSGALPPLLLRRKGVVSNHFHLCLRVPIPLSVCLLHP